MSAAAMQIILTVIMLPVTVILTIVQWRKWKAAEKELKLTKEEHEKARRELGFPGKGAGR